MKKLLVLLIAYCLLLLSLPKDAYSQPPQSWTSADMYLALRKLNVLGSVLYIAAHPDDENTRLIAYFSKDKMYRTGYLSITRGDGGQNLIGNEQGIELGLIRTQELLSARRIDGGEQFFSRAYDFGYSKSPEETFTKWDKEKILGDVVWVIRKFQPDVIITRFPTTGEGGHGHHSASAILANEAFTAAADPSRFPEQLSAGSGEKYVQPWQAKRILWNTFNFGSTNTTNADQFHFDVGGYNPLLGKSYGEIAAISRSNHKSQGFGSTATRGESIEFFKTTGGTAPSADLMDAVELTWNRVAGAERIGKMVDSLSGSFDLMHPERSVKGLVRLYQSLHSLPDGYWRDKKLAETQQLIEQCSGLFLDATTTQQFAVHGDSVRINFSLNNRLGVNATLKKVFVDAFDSTFDQTLNRNKNVNFGKTFYVSYNKPFSQPYWLMGKMEQGYFNVTNQAKIGQADVDPAYVANITLNIEGQELSFYKPVKYKFTDPVKGELYQPMVVLPVFSVFTTTPVVYNTKNRLNSFNISIRPNANFSITNGPVYAGPFCDTIYLRDSITSNLVRDKVVSFDFNNYKVVKPVCMNKIFPAAGIAKNALVLDWEQIRISYNHIPDISYFKRPEIKFVYNDADIYGKKIGYIVGAGDKVPEALEQMGYDVTLLTDKELIRNNLDQFDAIITGVRAYNTNEWMNKHYDKLMKYVNEGGNLIVQYNTSNQIGPVRAKIGPYNFNITRIRVTDENAAVTLLKPEHPVFNFPNKITQDDFKGWIQERSIYHASDTTGKFEKLIGMSDPGEKSDDGSLIVTKYGKGWFTYTGIVFFRELPAGVPGAYRLLANIIALNKMKGF